VLLRAGEGARDARGAAADPSPVDALAWLRGGSHATVLVLDTPCLHGGRGLSHLGAVVAAALRDGRRHDRDLAAVLGLGPELVRSIDPTLPGAEALPAFASDASRRARMVGGDVLVLISGDTAAAVRGTGRRVAAALAPASRLRWARHGVRGAPDHLGRRRDVTGFHDGLVQPPAEAAGVGVLLRGDPRVAGGTLAALRLLRVDVERFGALTVAEQERVIGRRRADGAPLSGGGPAAELDLDAEGPDGASAVPRHAHVRAAHPRWIGAPLMLRAGYDDAGPAGGDDGGDGEDAGAGHPPRGRLFLSYQDDLRTYALTQHRLDELDALSAYTTALAGASFLVLPMAHDRPFGWSLAG